MRSQLGTAWLVTAMLGCATSVKTPTARARPFVEHEEPGVVVVALGEESMLMDEPTGVLAIQLQIAAKASRNGSVIILVPSAEVQGALAVSCRGYGDLCDRIHDGSVRVLVEPHEGAWIRDYGPFVDVEPDGRIAVLDAKYEDGRRKAIFEYKREHLNELRRKTLEERVAMLRVAARYGLDDEDGASKVALQSEDVLSLDEGELARLYEDEGNTRTRAVDDDAPFYVAEAALGFDRFDLIHSDIFLDGGNLFRLADGRCITTTDTIANNLGNKTFVESVLRDQYRCAAVTFLEPLPGESIIKHVDMFLMPVAQRTVLLASYAPDSLRFRERWQTLSVDLRGLVTDAAIAMARNKKRLEALGYRVIDVVSPFPKRKGDRIYFPTLLNGVVQVDKRYRKHVLLPDYESETDDEAAVREAAKRTIENAFGPGVDFDTIESSASAELQGALHCLTTVLPERASVFANDDGMATAIRRHINDLTPRKVSLSPSLGQDPRRDMLGESYESSEECIRPYLGEWREFDDTTDRVGHAEGALVLVITSDAIRATINEDEAGSFKLSARCTAARPNEVSASFVDASGAITEAKLALGANGTMVLSDDGEKYTFTRKKAAAKAAPSKPTASKKSKKTPHAK